MKSLEEIEKMKEWLIKALDDEENQSELMQVKLYAKLDLLRWLEV